MTFVTMGGTSGRLPDLSVEIDVTTAPTTGVRTWTDVTRQVRQLTFARSGRNDELQRTETGTLTMLLNNRSDVITALGLKKAQWVRVQARWAGVTYSRWQGIIEGVPRQWPQAGKDSVVQLRAADVLKVFRLYDLVGQTFSAQRNDQRVSAIATLAGITTSSIDTDTDAADAISTAISENNDALSALLDIEESENGLVIAEPDGRLSFQGRHWRMLNSTTPVATFSDNGSLIPYRDAVTYEDDDTKIANIVAVTPSGGIAEVASDATSQSSYFTRRINRSLLSSSSVIAADAANYLLNKYKDPSPRIPVIEVPLAAVPSASKPALLAAGNSSRFTWTRTATTPITADVYVEQVGETITPDEWTIRFQLSPAGDESGWVLGDAVNGLLGTTTRLVY